MPSDDFHGKPYNEGTLCKLHIFELYAREWFPVFLSSEKPRRKAIHVFDFFADQELTAMMSLAAHYGY